MLTLPDAPSEVWPLGGGGGGGGDGGGGKGKEEEEEEDLGTCTFLNFSPLSVFKKLRHFVERSASSCSRDSGYAKARSKKKPLRQKRRKC